MCADNTLAIKHSHDNILVTDEEMEYEIGYNERGDELFDDFLYSYINDEALRLRRTTFPLKEYLIDGGTKSIHKDKWNSDFDHMLLDYTTAIYNSEKEKNAKYDTCLVHAIVEKIDLDRETITSYDFINDGGKWSLVAIKNSIFQDSDLSDFLFFYSKFSNNQSYQYKSIAKSIRISMMMPGDDSQNIEGFVTREQWSTLNSDIPGGIIYNVRYGQKFHNPKQIILEKVGLGNGMSESFYFTKIGNLWKLTGYEN